MNTFSASAAIRFGWETFKKRPGFLIGAFVVMTLIGIIFRYLSVSFGDSGVAVLVGLLTYLASYTLINMGRNSFLLRAHDSLDSVTLKALWHPQSFWSYLAAQILFGIAIVIGFMLLIIPGIIVALAYQFWSYIVIDRNLGPIEALKESARITRGHRWELLGFFVLILLLNLVGTLALLVGLLVTIPVTSLATVHAYRTLEHQASEVAPTSA